MPPRLTSTLRDRCSGTCRLFVVRRGKAYDQSNASERKGGGARALGGKRVKFSSTPLCLKKSISFLGLPAEKGTKDDWRS